MEFTITNRSEFLLEFWLVFRAWVAGMDRRAPRGPADSVISCRCSLVKVVNRGQLVMPLGSAAALTHRPASGTAVTTAAVVHQPARWYHS